MIIDCFTFFNELDILQIRLEELYNTVDYFVLVEASKTQSLLPKKYYFEENKERYKKYLDKIIHVKVDDCPDNSSDLWTMENFQRNAIVRGINQISNISDNDVILISDLDEIPNHKILKQIDSIEEEAFSFEMLFCAYYLNLIAAHRQWIGTVACKYKIFKNLIPQHLRNVKDQLPCIRNAGWHFSWMGGYEKIYEKSLSCIEPFNKKELPSKEEFKKHFENFAINDNKFFIHLENLSKKETEFKKIQVNETFPMFVIENQTKLSEYII
jgi:beta-1,4-mannosyl-glycoprotein beta-1,4-N-acetylglucosaminyltransferase